MRIEILIWFWYMVGILVCWAYDYNYIKANGKARFKSLWSIFSHAFMWPVTLVMLFILLREKK